MGRRHEPDGRHAATDDATIGTTDADGHESNGRNESEPDGRHEPDGGYAAADDATIGNADDATTIGAAVDAATIRSTDDATTNRVHARRTHGTVNVRPRCAADDANAWSSAIWYQFYEPKYADGQLRRSCIWNVRIDVLRG